MNAVITASYLAVYGLVQIALTEYNTRPVKVQSKSNRWQRLKKAFKEAISFSYNHLF